MKDCTILFFLFLFFQNSGHGQCPTSLILLDSQDDIDNFATNFPGCTEPDSVRIEEATPGDIVNLNGLSGITSVDEFLWIIGNSALTDLSGLDNLASVGSLRFHNNDALINFNGLNSLTSVEGFMTVFDNDALTDLSGLENLASIGHTLFIEKNDALTNLNSLSNLTLIHLRLVVLDNPALISLSGLGNISFTFGQQIFIRNNDALTNLVGLENIASIGNITVLDNDALTSLSGLDNLASVSSLNLFANDALTDLSALNGLSTVNVFLRIDENPALTNLNGLENLASIADSLLIRNNAALTDISAIVNADLSAMELLAIEDNVSLPACATANICDYLGVPANVADISGNATGCASRAEVETICGFPMQWTGAVNNVWGNPSNWSQVRVPNMADELIIPTASTVDINVSASANTIDIQGNAAITMNQNLTIGEEATIGANATFDWVAGQLGGGGILTNNGTLTLTGSGDQVMVGTTTLNNEGTMSMSTSGTFIIGEDAVFNHNSTSDFSINMGTVSNLGDINLTSSGDLSIGPATLENEVTGTILLQGVNSNIFDLGGVGQLTNEGLIRKTSTGSASLSKNLQNNGGTLTVENGTLNMDGDGSAFTGGTLNVSAGAEMNWLADFSFSGNINGTVDGNLNWTEAVNVPTAATFGFSGNINWLSGELDGGSTLTNNSTLIMAGSADKDINGSTTLHNTASGTIDIQTGGWDINSGTGILVNEGILQKTGGGNSNAVFVELQNNGGTINVENGLLNLDNSASTFAEGTINVSLGAAHSWLSPISFSGNMDGNVLGSLNCFENMNVPAAAVFDFSGNMNWQSGNLIGGGTLTNQGDLHLISNSDKTILGSSTLRNEGDIEMSGTGNLDINEGAVDNQLSGTISIMADGADIAFSNPFNFTQNLVNSGVIEKTGGAGTASILAMMTNSGTLESESGTLIINNGNNSFSGGTYNVSGGCAMNWLGSIFCSGTLTGSTPGSLNWLGTITTGSPPFGSPATFHFPQGINWADGQLGNGFGGTLINTGLLNLTGSADKNMMGGTFLENQSTLNITSDGDLICNGNITNTASATINLMADGGDLRFPQDGPNTLTNQGMLLKSAGSGTAEIHLQVDNSGTIDVQEGTLDLTHVQTSGAAPESSFVNQTNGTVKGIGTLELPILSIYTNHGTFAPGASPGTLHVTGDFESTASSVLDIELDGTTQGVNYDFLDITGDAEVNGGIQVSLGFLPMNGQTFTILQSGGTLTANLPGLVSASSNGTNVDFTVTTNANQVILQASSPLPVELFDFSAKHMDGSVRLTWQTASETENAGFEIEKSTEGRQWESIGFVEGKGHSTDLNEYVFMDEKPLSSQQGGCKGGCINYYRLRQMDLGGEVFYSPVRSVLFYMEGPSVSFYPNPFSGHLNLEWEGNTDDLFISIFDPFGHRIYSTEKPTAQLDLSELPPGTYFLEIGKGGHRERYAVLKKD